MVPATLEHALELAENMRDADRQEAWDLAHHTPEQATVLSLEASGGTTTGLADGKVVCMFGVESAAIISTTGVPWLLTTDGVERHAQAFLRRNRKVVADMRGRYPLLRNYVDERNLLSIKWLKWLGFDVMPPVPFGVERFPFHPFEMRA